MRQMTRLVAVAVAASMLVAPPLRAAGVEVRAFMTIAVRSAVEALIPPFERTSGHRIVPTWATSAMLNERIRSGEAADLLISTRSGIETLAKTGSVLGDSAADIASVGIGIAIRQGAPRPDVSTSEALKRTLLAARAVSFSDPAAGGVSGVHFARVLERLGIAGDMKAKSRFPPPGGLSADLLVTGETEIAVQQVSELLAVKGVTLVGPLPGDLQLVTMFTAGIPAAAKQVEAGQAFIRFAQSAAAAPVLTAHGLDAPAPGKTR